MRERKRGGINVKTPSNAWPLPTRKIFKGAEFRALNKKQVHRTRERGGGVGNVVLYEEEIFSNEGPGI